MAQPGVTLVLGGARSGKSRFAEAMAERADRPLYLATGRAWDGEMASRIDEHRDRRGPRWTTVEEPLDLAGTLPKLAAPDAVVLVDCLTLWVTNLMMEQRDIAAETRGLVQCLGGLAGPVVFVSNEVGLGIVPDNAMARAFRDHAGRLHQEVAAVAGAVHFMVAGIPMTVKSTC
ncbi:adenosylcobinamide kinase [Skermanella stibiiresistens SB22]|uniref:Bifunctional adenosylcobalamin biosynthesis protein n=1 Tax=Skermanella stibiiresistens SB22 TaxID=1385369 RepID=W9H2K1_9PROT|nr:adenosylcobinamide kinase [Skermanella stibiiresistens SB22]